MKKTIVTMFAVLSLGLPMLANAQAIWGTAVPASCSGPNPAPTCPQK